MTGTNCDLFTHNQSRSYLNHLVHRREETRDGKRHKIFWPAKILKDFTT
jgi:hypothetical protein